MDNKLYYSNPFQEGKDVSKMDKHYLVNAFKKHIRLTVEIKSYATEEYIENNLRLLEEEIIKRLN